MDVITKMELRMKSKRIVLIAIFMLVASVFVSNGYAISSLSDPTTYIDGIPVAQQYDDFYSYSGGFLSAWGFSEFDKGIYKI